MRMAINNPTSLLFPPLISLLIITGKFFSTINGQDFTIEETSIEEIQRAFTENRLTSRQLVDYYLDRIETLNPLLRSVVEVNPDAQDQADEADRERGMKGDRSILLGELHGIPVLLKDTIATKDKLNTTAGSYALLGSVVPRDAGVVERLRKAGAVILGKASLTEWYSFRSLGHVPNGWCARTGQGMNPYVPSGNPCGSSSGSAISVAANMVTVSLGCETHGSILCPADHNSVVGFQPTVGLTSRAGVIPILPRHDTIGAISRTVSDAVYVLDVIAGFDPQDYEATKETAKFIPVGDVDVILNQKRSGELTAMLAEFKVSVNDYLKDLISSPVRSLADIIAFNQNNPDLENTKEYGQATFIASEKTSGIGEKERQAIELMENLSRNGFEKLMMENELDALVTPGTGAIPVLAIGGHPGITVPAGYDSDGMPFGICFGGTKGTEPKLIEIAYAFEQVSSGSCHNINFSIKEVTIHDLQLALKQNELTSRQLVELYLKEIRRLNPILKGVIELNPDALCEADKADYERKAKVPGSQTRLHGVVTKLRKAGAIILGKASLGEWSHFRTARGPLAWSARGGQGKNPYTLGEPCGSSSGSSISVAANMVAVSLGTETDGSIICPASFNSVVGIKPTVGLTSRAGDYPNISKAGHCWVGIDNNDNATFEASGYIPKGGYGQFLKVNGLKGKRLGIVRNPFFNFGNNTFLNQTFEQHFDTLSGEETALLAEFKISLNAYLNELVSSPVRTMADVIAFNNKNPELELINKIDQDHFLSAEATTGIGKAEKAALLNLARLSRDGFEKLMTNNKLDALVTPSYYVSSVLAIGGFPGVSVPAGYDTTGVPFGICFGGLKGSEPKLIEIAYGFEQATKIRRPPLIVS
uniref:Amidase domain-containing protein n=1 Tax=Fagus sylvatica TaxID=28930 RepID=A0A2N9HEC8_FAGSY